MPARAAQTGRNRASAAHGVCMMHTQACSGARFREITGGNLGSRSINRSSPMPVPPACSAIPPPPPAKSHLVAERRKPPGECGRGNLYRVWSLRICVVNSDGLCGISWHHRTACAVPLQWGGRQLGIGRAAFDAERRLRPHKPAPGYLLAALIRATKSVRSSTGRSITTVLGSSTVTYRDFHELR